MDEEREGRERLWVELRYREAGTLSVRQAIAKGKSGDMVCCTAQLELA